jgi:eukaryotic-like serine/threonine-protein kinase
MTEVELKDNDCPHAIRESVRNNPDIDIYQYIKRGNNGDVYFGKRKKLGDDVVLKFYWASPNFDSSEEAVILRQIEHKNILKIHDLKSVPPNYAYFLTPRISGGDLQEHLDNHILSSKEALEIIAGVLLGLTELHSKHNLVHRDLKPGNILLEIKKKIKAIIADLGAVKKIDSPTSFVTASKAAYVYLPPESTRENKYYFQSDIYQVGITMYQTLCGAFPLQTPEDWCTLKEKQKLDTIKNADDWNRKLEECIGKRIASGNIINVNTLPAHLDKAFRRVISKATHLVYSKRYKSAAEFLKDIHSLIRDFPDYRKTPDSLEVKHINEREFKIYKNRDHEFVVERKLRGGSWRKDNSHDGTLESILEIARKK